MIANCNKNKHIDQQFNIDTVLPALLFADVFAKTDCIKEL
jgi:hypothetical protein